MTTKPDLSWVLPESTVARLCEPAGEPSCRYLLLDQRIEGYEFRCAKPDPEQAKRADAMAKTAVVRCSGPPDFERK